MCQTKQCRALKLGRTRCENSTIHPGSDHCSLHHEKARKLYVKYKKLCEVAYALKVEDETNITDVNEKIRFLNKCHNLFTQAYHARMEHRKFAFAPEFYDEGHNIQFQFIQQKIDFCFDKLNKIYDGLKTPEEKSVEVDDADDVDAKENEIETDVREMKKTMDSFHKFRKQQQRDKREEDRMLAAYIAENKKLEKVRNKNLIRLATVLKDHINVEDHPFIKGDEAYLQSLLFDLVIRLLNIDYFEPTYKPPRCKKCNCNCPDVLCEIRIGCPCVETCKHIVEILRHSTLTSIQFSFCTYVCCEEPDKIIPIANDLINLYKIYERTTHKSPLDIVWNNKENRLKLQDCCVTTDRHALVKYRR
jgi:hypothetical protein